MRKSTILFAILALSLFMTASAQQEQPGVYVNMDEVGGLTPEGKIPTGGTDLTIPISFYNPVESPGGIGPTAISNGYYFDSPEITLENISFEWNSEYPWTPFLAYLLGCIEPTCYAWFDYTNYVTPFDKGLGGYGVVALSGDGHGLPMNFNDVAYTLTLNGVSGPSGAVLTMDSSWFPAHNYWLWSDIPDIPTWGGPYEFEVEGGCPEPYTTYWPEPVQISIDRVLNVSIFCEENELVDLSSVRVFGKIPSLSNDGVAWIDGDSIVTDVSLMRFLGAGGFRPLDPQGIVSTYFVTYTKAGVEHSLVGDFVMQINQGDVTFDGTANIDDIIFMTEHLFGGGPGCELDGYPMPEIMDVDQSGRFDLLDVRALIEKVY